MFGRRLPPGGVPKIDVTLPLASDDLADFEVPRASALALSRTTTVTTSLTRLGRRSEASSPKCAEGDQIEPELGPAAEIPCDSRTSRSMGLSVFFRGSALSTKAAPSRSGFVLIGKLLTAFLTQFSRLGGGL
jgi:hypothetical protein